jgi:4-amino-4-deoxy-L-arabinose transferase-like glycosyltransferase
VRATLRRVPVEGWVCALVACLSAASWSFVTPPFQLTDEPDHFAYAQQLARSGRLPAAAGPIYSAEEGVALDDLHFLSVRQRPGAGTISTRAEQQRLQSDLTKVKRLDQTAAVTAGVAHSQPPLYYALAAIPYSLAAGGSLLDRLALMRLFSALMAGLTALFVFLFLRESLPADRWSWIVGGLGVALFPLLGFMSGGVSPEGMFYAVSAALFYCLARAFRRGLTRPLALAIGAVIAVGLLTKLNFVSLVPGAAVGLAVLARRGARSGDPAAYRTLGLALGIALSPAVLYALVNALSHHATFGQLSTTVLATSRHGSLLGEISYIWQFYFPRLPGMGNDFVGLLTIRQVWFNGLVGLYGWLDTVFPGWVYDVALIPAGLIAAFCARTLVVERSTLRARLAELATYGLMAVGLAGSVAATAYLEFPREVGNYAEPRYLLPLLVAWGAILALATRGAGRRWGPAVGATIVVLAFAHDLFSQLLVISRYYG